jgi:hypothetical protein
MRGQDLTKEAHQRAEVRCGPDAGDHHGSPCRGKAAKSACGLAFVTGRAMDDRRSYR